MPRPAPSLRRTVSTPSVRPRASSNPYPPVLASTRSYTSSVVSAVVVAGTSSTPATPSFPPPTVATRTRRVNSASSSSGTYECTRRVLQDITWCFDGQLQSSAPIIVADPDVMLPPPTAIASAEATVASVVETGSSSLDAFNIEDLERLSLGASTSLEGNASIMEEDESSVLLLDGESDAGMLAPLRAGTPEAIDTPHVFVSLLEDRCDSMPSSAESSPSRPAGRAAVDLGFGFAIDFTRSLAHNRRESSFSSISSCSDFEDHVPSPTYF